MKLLYIDLFCGAGGTSTGVETARIDGQQFAKVIACVNHDKNAIASHAANHPDALHFTEDIRTLDLTALIDHTQKMRELYPEAVVVLWASLECTNFSKAKGGQPRNADSRTLAEHLFRYIEAIDPEYIKIENVEEFMSWGDLDDNGKPISRDKGRLYMEWIGNVKSYGYDFQHRIMNSADFGAYTSRRRFFGTFAKYEYPIVFPEPTHTKNPQNSLFTPLQKWKPVREVLDLDDVGESIFDRKKPLVEATLERIYAGLIKFVAGGKDAFMVKYNSVNGKTGKHIPPSLDDPCPVVSTQGRLGLAKVHFMQQRNTGTPSSKVYSVDAPARTVTTTGGNQEVVAAHFLSKYYSGHPEHKNITVDGPAGAITTKDSHAFITAYYGNGFSTSVEDPAATVTTKDRFNLVRSRFLDMQYGNGGATSLESPVGAVTLNPKHHLVTCAPWVMSTNFGNVGRSIDEPSQVVTANRKHQYLMNPQFASAGGSVDKPCFTLIARMDKMPPYLISADQFGQKMPSFVKIYYEGIIIEIYESDSPAMRRIKEFMVIYNIIDIFMRMLKILELKMIMGFPKDYILIGTQADQKKYIGNAVEVTMARKDAEALGQKLIELKISAA